MAQHARPHWYTHSEYERLMLNNLVRGAGMRPRSTRPISSTLRSSDLHSLSHPPKEPALPGVDQSIEQQHDEDQHGDEPEGAVPLDVRGPREEEHRFHVEDDEQQREDVVADLALRPAHAHRVDTRLVGDALVVVGPGGAHEGRQSEEDPADRQGGEAEPDHGQVIAQEHRHRVENLSGAGKTHPNVASDAKGRRPSGLWAPPVTEVGDQAVEAVLSTSFGPTTIQSAPARAAPIAGNTMNAHTWPSAQSPWNTAVASERAGLTDVFDTGIEIMCTSARPKPAAMGPKPFGTPLSSVVPSTIRTKIAVTTISMIATDSSAKPPGELSP